MEASMNRFQHQPASVAWECLAAGIPLTLLLDLAAGTEIDSHEILADEQAAELEAAAWAGAAAAAGKASTSGWTALPGA
jgi:hypothetical protein